MKCRRDGCHNESAGGQQVYCSRKCSPYGYLIDQERVHNAWVNAQSKKRPVGRPRKPPRSIYDAHPGIKIDKGKLEETLRELKIKRRAERAARHNREEPTCQSADSAPKHPKT